MPAGAVRRAAGVASARAECGLGVALECVEAAVRSDLKLYIGTFRSETIHVPIYVWTHTQLSDRRSLQLYVGRRVSQQKHNGNIVMARGASCLHVPDSH
jgi:hypothetical protein